MKTKQIVAIALIALMLFGIVYASFFSGPKPIEKVDPKGNNAKPTVQAPDFNADSAYAFVKTQVAFGPRVPNLPAHTQCGDWLESKFTAYGAKVYAQKAPLIQRDGKTIQIRNIIAQFQPEKKNRVLLCAHWDTRPIADKDPDPAKKNKPIDGANDGGSGVGVLLEIARMMQVKSPEIGVDIILFDAEDNGAADDEDPTKTYDNEGFLTDWCLGSQYWGKNMYPANYNPRFGILLDMVGAADAIFNREATSVARAGDVLNLVWATAQKIGYDNYFRNVDVDGVTDDHSFVNMAGIRCIDIIDTRPETAVMGLGNYKFGPYHHTHKDNMDIIDPNTLKAVGQTVMQVIYNQ